MINLKTQNWQINNIDTIIFDKDGTIIDLHYFWGKMTELRAKEIIKRYNLDETLFNQICLYLGFDIKTQKMLSDGITALYSRNKIIEIFSNDLKKHDIKHTTKELEEIFDYVSSIFYKDIKKYTTPINEARNCIKKVHTYGVKLAIVTSDSKESTMLTLKDFNWEKYFDVVIGRECTVENKESGIPTKLALDMLGANSNTTVMIGDAPMDFISAKNACIEKTILVSSGQIEKKELENVSNYVVTSLDEIVIQ